MTKASDNAYPSILVTEGTEPSAPAAGKQRLYIDSTTHHLMRVPSSGTEVDIETAATGAPSTADYLVGTANGSLSAEIVVGTTPGGELGGTWASPTVDKLHAGARHYVAFKVVALSANATESNPNTTYLDWFTTTFKWDWDVFPATHFAISCYGFAVGAGQTISLQMTEFGSPTNPISSGGNDLVITDNSGVATHFDSGWIAVSDSMAGRDVLQVALKGSNSTVDLTYRWIQVEFKVA